jgi:hypothetical protein
MSTQLWGLTDAGPGGGRDRGHIFNAVAANSTPKDVQYILSAHNIDNFSIHLYWTTHVTCTDVKVYTSNSFQPNPAAPQDETVAMSPGKWVDTGSRWTTGFTAPAASASQGEICSQGKPVDAG